MGNSMKCAMKCGMKCRLRALLAREFGYVLTSRQMGQSSLMVRTAYKLREQPARTPGLFRP